MKHERVSYLFTEVIIVFTGFIVLKEGFGVISLTLAGLGLFFIISEFLLKYIVRKRIKNET